MSARDILARALPIPVGTVGTLGTAAETLGVPCPDLQNSKSGQSGQNLPEHHGQPWADDPGEMHNWIDAPENESRRNPHVPTCPDHVPIEAGALEAAETLDVPTVPTCSDPKQQAARQFELCMMRWKRRFRTLLSRKAM